MSSADFFLLLLFLPRVLSVKDMNLQKDKANKTKYKQKQILTLKMLSSSSPFILSFALEANYSN